MSLNKNKKINTSPDSNIIKQEFLRTLSKIMFGEGNALYKSLESTVSSLLEGDIEAEDINSCINDSIELYEENISSKIESLFAWYEIELNHSILKNFQHEIERKIKMEYTPSLELKEQEVPF